MNNIVKRQSAEVALPLAKRLKQTQGHMVVISEERKSALMEMYDLYSSSEIVLCNSSLMRNLMVEAREAHGSPLEPDEVKMMKYRRQILETTVTRLLTDGCHQIARASGILPLQDGQSER